MQQQIFHPSIKGQLHKLLAWGVLAFGGVIGIGVVGAFIPIITGIVLTGILLCWVVGCAIFAAIPIYDTKKTRYCIKDLSLEMEEFYRLAPAGTVRVDFYRVGDVTVMPASFWKASVLGLRDIKISLSLPDADWGEFRVWRDLERAEEVAEIIDNRRLEQDIQPRKYQAVGGK